MSRQLVIAAGFFGLLMLVAGPIWQAREQLLFGDGYDDAIYWSGAKALASGAGYRILSLPGQPWAVKYPPLYPLYLSLAWRVRPSFPANLPVASALQAALMPLFLALVLLTFRSFGYRAPKVFLLGAMSVVTLELVLLGITLFSDLLFFCLLFASILAMERAAKNAGPSVGSAALSPTVWASIAGLLAGAAYMTRTAGIPLFAAVPIFCILRKRVRLSFVFLACALPAAVVWHAWTFSHAANGDGGYLQEYLRAIHGVGFWTNVETQLGALSGAVAADVTKGIADGICGWPVQHVFLLAAIAGCIRMGRRRGWPLFLVFTGLYLPMLLCWWFNGLDRLVIPVFPALLAGMAEEAEHFASLARHAPARKTLRATMATAALLIVAYNTWVAWSFVSSEVAARRAQRPKREEAFAWIRARARRGDVVLTWKDGLTALYTGVPASRNAFSAVVLRPNADRAPAALPQQYNRGLVLLTISDLGGGDERARLTALKKLGDALPGAQLEYASDAALIYSLPFLKTASVRARCDLPVSREMSPRGGWLLSSSDNTSCIGP